MAHSNELKTQLRRSYVFDRLSLEVAALKHGVSYNTARRWKQQAAENGDDWDKAQAAQLISSGNIEDIGRQMLAGLVTQYQTTMEQVQQQDDLDAAVKVKLLASLADAFNKTISSSKRILPETNELAIAMDVIQKLADFICNQFPQHTKAFNEILEPFGEVLSESLAQ